MSLYYDLVKELSRLANARQRRLANEVFEPLKDSGLSKEELKQKQEDLKEEFPLTTLQGFHGILINDVYKDQNGNERTGAGVATYVSRTLKQATPAEIEDLIFGNAKSPALVLERLVTTTNSFDYELAALAISEKLCDLEARSASEKFDLADDKIFEPEFILYFCGNLPYANRDEKEQFAHDYCRAAKNAWSDPNPVNGALRLIRWLLLYSASSSAKRFADEIIPLPNTSGGGTLEEIEYPEDNSPDLEKLGRSWRLVEGYFNEQLDFCVDTEGPVHEYGADARLKIGRSPEDSSAYPRYESLTLANAPRQISRAHARIFPNRLRTAMMFEDISKARENGNSRTHIRRYGQRIDCSDKVELKHGDLLYFRQGCKGFLFEYCD